MRAGVGHHPSVTVATHAFRIRRPGEDAGRERAEVGVPPLAGERWAILIGLRSPHPGETLLEFTYRVRDTHARKMRSEQT
jgi:hypothetical protein